VYNGLILAADFTYDTLRKGTNQLVCYDRSGFPPMQPFAVQCTSLGNLPRRVHHECGHDDGPLDDPWTIDNV